MTPTQTCQEILQELLGPHLSTPTLEGILSQLGAIGARPLCQLDSPTAGALRRRLERIGRSYLDPKSSADTLHRFDQLLATAGIKLPAYDPASSGVFSALTLGLPPTGHSEEKQKDPLRTANPLSTDRLGSTTPYTPKTPFYTGETVAPQPPQIFPFQSEDELNATLKQVHSVLLDYLGDETVALRLEAGLTRAAQGNLRVGGGEIHLELDAGLKGRLVFKVVGKDGQVRLSGAALASR